MAIAVWLYIFSAIEKLHVLCLLQTIGGHNDYITIPAEHHQSVRSSVASNRQSNDVHTLSRNGSTSRNVLQAHVITDHMGIAESAVYETLRQDAYTGHATVAENPYLIPSTDSVLANGEVSRVSTMSQNQIIFQVVSSDCPSSSNLITVQQHRGPFGCRIASASTNNEAGTVSVLSVTSQPRASISENQSAPSSALASHLDCRESFVSSDGRPGSRTVYDRWHTEDVSKTSLQTDDPSSSYSLDPTVEQMLRQTEELKNEIAQSEGIGIVVSKTHCLSPLALVDCYDKVW